MNRQVLAQQWATLNPVAPLAWNDVLAGTALAHSQLMLQFDQQSHQLPGEPDLLTRIQAAGYDVASVGENIFAYAAGIFDTHAAFAIDWGSTSTGIQDPPGHRLNLMDTSFQDVGIGLVNGVSGHQTGPLLVSEDFGEPASPGNPFLVGAVYSDTNSDGFYSQGEGLGGVNVTLAGTAGTFTTTTSAAGGYQLPLPAGNYTATYSGGGLTGTITKPVTVATDNVLLDINALAAPTVQFSSAAYNVSESAGSIAITVTRAGDAAGRPRFTTPPATAPPMPAPTTRPPAATSPLARATRVRLLRSPFPTIRRPRATGPSTWPSAAREAQALGSPAAAVLTITQPLPSQLRFSVASSSVARTAGTAIVTVVRTGGLSDVVTVRYATSDGTARAGTDYTAASGTLTFDAGNTAQTISVKILDAGQNLGSETVNLTFSAPTDGATLAPPGAAVLTINDPLPQNPLPGSLPSVANLLTHASEAFGLFVTQAYSLYLKRTPDAAGLAFWVNQLQNAGLTDEILESSFLGSAEYIRDHGGSGAGWVIGMYQDLLGRTPDAAGLSYWASQLAQGALPAGVALGFAAGAEREGKRIAADYQVYLGALSTRLGRRTG